jgi:hypothetical protein
MSGGRLVFSLPDCGSPWLAGLLDAHPALHCFQGPFDPDVSDPTGRRTAAPNLGSVDAVLDGIWARWPVIAHVWTPAGWPFARHSPLNGHVLLRASHVVLLSRRNRLVQAVSQALAARAVETAASGEPEPLDLASIAWLLKQIPPTLRTHRRVLYTRDRPLLDLEYEQLFGPGLDLEARRATLERVFAFLGHGAGDDGVDRDAIARILDNVHASAPLRPWESVPNIGEIESALGSDETGWLLR